MARLARRGLVLGALVAGAPALAECVPLLGGWECDFKNEDTHLGFTQPGWKLISDDSIDRLVSDGWSALEQYRAGVTTRGDAAIRGRLDALERRVRAAREASVRELARTATNDPFSLKPIYTDLVFCVPYWELVFGRDCPSTPELVLDARRVGELLDLEVAFGALRLDPGLVLGEAWGELAPELIAVRETFDRTRTLSANLDPAARLARYRETFSDHRTMLAGPPLSVERWQAERKAISATLHDTLLDVREAASELGGAQGVGDRAALAALVEKSRRALGRRQLLELDAMGGTQSAEAWLKLTEGLLHRGDLIALDMADELHRSSRLDAEAERALEQLPGLGTVVGNEPGVTLR